MGNLKKSIEAFAQRGKSFLQTRQSDALMQIKDNFNRLTVAIENSPTPMAMSAWKPVDDSTTPSCLVAPSKLRFGNFQLLNSKGVPVKDIDIPLLLPIKTNAVLLNMGEDAEKVPNLFQNIILRLLLSMRMDLVKVSIIDMDFGASFPTVSTITNPMFKSQIIYKQEDVNKLVDGLAREISEANKNILGRSSDIDAYNTNSNNMAFPYHFVFIDDFPNGFSSQSLDNLLRLIDNGNAQKAGIRIFINFSEKNPQPRDFDIQRFAKVCSCICMVGGKVQLENIDFNMPSRALPLIELEPANRTSEYVDYINSIKPRTITYTLDGWIDDLKKNDEVWKGSTIDGINVPIGYITPTQHFNFYMANDNDGSCNDFFALIAGRPGYGKTVLLHNIIINSAMKYSPEELCLYLADFAEGASFSIYRELPHVRSLMLANNKEYALRMLDDIVLEAKKRSHLYQKAQRQFGRQITKLSEYREVTNEPLPRILFIMDEFHTLFLSTDNTTIRAKEELCNGIRQWRKFGISIILCTQSINGVNFGSADTQITYRFALNLLEMDSKSVIRNDAAKTLTRKGQTIMNNTADGRADMNMEFQSAFTPHYLDYVKYLAQLYAQKYNNLHRPYICEAGANADILDNLVLKNLIESGNSAINTLYCDVYVGKPDLLRDSHTRLRYRRQQNSNTLLIGDDYRTLVYDVMVQLIQMRYQSIENSKFYIVDCFNAGDTFEGALSNLENISNCFVYGNSQSAPTYIEDIYTELERRKEVQKEGKMTEERIVLTILNAQNCYALKPQQGKYGMEQSDMTKKLIVLLSEGAPLGIHCMLHGLSYETLFKTNGILESSKHFSMFENLLLLKGADTSNMFLGGLKVAAPDEEGQIVVINAKADGEAYEQCNAYSEFTSNHVNDTIEYMNNLFDKYRYV